MEFTQAAGRQFSLNEAFLKRNLLLALNRLPENLKEDFLSYGEYFANNRTSFIRRMMYNYCLYSGFLQASVAVNESPIFTFGAEIVPWASCRESESASQRELLHSQAMFRELEILAVKRQLAEKAGTLEFFGIVPAASKAIAETLVSGNIVPFLRNYFSFQADIKDSRYEDLFTHSVEVKVRELIRQSSMNGGGVCLTHLRFQESKIYFDLLGEHRTLETIQGNYNLIRSKLKDKDSVFILSPVSYLIASPGTDCRTIVRRFADVFFPLGSIIIDYDLLQYNLTEDPGSFFSVWQVLKI